MLTIKNKYRQATIQTDFANQCKNRICYMDFANVGICYVDFAMPHCVFFMNFNKIFTDLLTLYSNKKQFYFQKKIAEMPAKRCKS